MSRLSIALALVAAFAAPAAARADTYTFTISTGTSGSGVSGTTFQASGTLTGTPNNTSPADTLDLSGVTGGVLGYTFTGIAPLNAVSGISYDNLLFTDPGATHVDSNGVLLYMLADVNPMGTSLAHVFEGSSGYEVDVYDPGDYADNTPFQIQNFDLTPATVPEPSTLALLGTGAFGLIGAVRRRLRV